jgi:hypothetical protein
MRKTVSVAALLLALVCSAHAGEMQNEAPKPPPQAATAIQEPTDGGTANSETPEGTADILTQIVSDVFAVLPSLL